MISALATNIISPLGCTTEENYRAVREYRSALSRYDSWHTIPEPFVASMFDAEQRERLSMEGYTLFEALAIRSVEDALKGCTIEITSPRTILILSTTKANVDELSSSASPNDGYVAPGVAARKVASYFGIVSEPIVVCNACISGVDAQLLALRLLSEGGYDNAIVCGVDVVSPFIIAGFLSFKSLSLEQCRPFDIERTGLNLGEAAATIVYTNRVLDGTPRWQLCSGAINNDAYHVSAPSPQGDGAVKAIMRAMADTKSENLALVSVHGTATMFNDQMESKAIERADLSRIPLSAIKGYYGHTLGAAGVLETILTMRALDDGAILGVRGFEEIGVSGKIDISSRERKSEKKSFLKMISGFGGCNGALLFVKQPYQSIEKIEDVALKVEHRVRLTPQSLEIDGDWVSVVESGKALLTELYKRYLEEYPKFYKMDLFSRVVLVATELLYRQLGDIDGKDSPSIILFNRSSSIVADRKHSASIEDRENFYPSPSIFLYTLPNIALGETAIKLHCTGETSLYILEERNETVMRQVAESVMSNSDIKTLITGWVDCSSEECFEADLQILTK